MTTETQAQTKFYYDDVQVGDAIPTLVKPPVTLNQLVRYAGASGDFNPLHTDPEVGKRIGTGGIIAHGMFVMGCVGQFMSDYAGPGGLRKFGVRFKSMTHLGDVLTCSGAITEKYEAEGEGRVAGEVKVADEKGDVKVVGTFVAALPKRS